MPDLGIAYFRAQISSSNINIYCCWVMKVARVPVLEVNKARHCSPRKQESETLRAGFARVQRFIVHRHNLLMFSFNDSCCSIEQLWSWGQILSVNHNPSVKQMKLYGAR